MAGRPRSDRSRSPLLTHTGTRSPYLTHAARDLADAAMAILSAATNMSAAAGGERISFEVGPGPRVLSPFKGNTKNQKAQGQGFGNGGGYSSGGSKSGHSCGGKGSTGDDGSGGNSSNGDDGKGSGSHGGPNYGHADPWWEWSNGAYRDD